MPGRRRGAPVTADPESIPGLLKHLERFVTPQKQARIDKVLPWRTRYISVVLEDIYQTQNASAVIRSCDLFGIQQVDVIESRNRFKVNKAVVQGASKWIDIRRHKGDGPAPTMACIDGLKKRGYHLAALTPENADCRLEDLPLDKPTALLFGGEEAGLSEAALEAADVRVAIPMFGFTRSFNLSVSVALVLQDVTRRLRASAIHWRLSDDEALELKLLWYQKSASNGSALARQYLARNFPST